MGSCERLVLAGLEEEAGVGNLQKPEKAKKKKKHKKPSEILSWSLWKRTQPCQHFEMHF